MPTYSFDEAKHVHMLDGKMIGGVTTVLNVIAKPALIPWAVSECVKWIEANCIHKKEGDEHYIVTPDDLKNAKKAHTKKKESAADWGTIVHKAIEVWIKTKNNPVTVEVGGNSYPLTEDHKHAVDSFIGWATKNNVEFLLSEKGIYSEEWQVGGIVDFVCKLNNKIYVGDIKTSSGIYETYWLQLSAYAKMLMEMKLFSSIENMIIINLKKDGKFDLEERGDVPYNIKCYEAAITLHNRLK